MKQNSASMRCLRIVLKRLSQEWTSSSLPKPVWYLEDMQSYFANLTGKSSLNASFKNIHSHPILSHKSLLSKLFLQNGNNSSKTAHRILRLREVISSAFQKSHSRWTPMTQALKKPMIVLCQTNDGTKQQLSGKLNHSYIPIKLFQIGL